MKIDPSIKERWVKSLKESRLPKNTQGMRNMETGAMDVLGHLCEVLRESMNAEWENESFVYRKRNYIYYPPISASLMIGLNHTRIENVPISYDGNSIPLYRLNDETNLTLSGIAKLIEEQL
jgi:hypothetical protein